MRSQTLPIGENVSHRAIVYMEEFALSHGLDLADALIAATVHHAGATLLTRDHRARSIYEHVGIRHELVD